MAFRKNWRFRRPASSILCACKRGVEVKGTTVMSTALPACRGDNRVSRTQGRYLVDARRTRVAVMVRCVGVPVRGVFDDHAGVLDVPADLTAARAVLCVDATSLRTGGRRRDRLAHAILDGQAHPAIRFEADRMEPIVEPFVTHDGDRPLWALVGHLTLAGVTRPIRLAVGVVRPVDNGAAIEFSATATVRCSDFGLHRRGGLVGDVVRVNIVGTADRDRD